MVLDAMMNENTHLEWFIAAFFRMHVSMLSFHCSKVKMKMVLGTLKTKAHFKNEAERNLFVTWMKEAT